MSDTWFINCEGRGNNLLLTYVHDEQIKYVKVPNYKPILFTSGNGQPSNFTELLTKKSLVAVQFDSIRDANDAIRESRDSGETLYGNRNFKYAFLHSQFKNMETAYDPKLVRGFFLDIECPSENGFPDPAKAEWPINLMGIYDTFTKKYHIWGLNKYDINKYADKLLESGVRVDEIIYHEFIDEVILLSHMLKWWNNNCPAYVTGWNTSGFDNPYLCHRLQKMGLDIGKLSPWGVTTIRESDYLGKTIFIVKILGVADLDYMKVYKDNRFKTQESYKLDHIAHVELGRKKVDYSEVASDLRTLHKKDWDLYATYNVMDCALVKQLDDKLGYINITLAVAYNAGINLDDVKSPVATWENILYRELIDKNIVLPPKSNNQKVNFEGGYVKSPQKGKHKWVCSFDLNSLYPHIIMGSNISPETITPVVVPEANVDNILLGIETGEPTCIIPKGNLSVCASGNTFSNDQMGVAGLLMEKLYIERKRIKTEMLVHEQDVQNIMADQLEGMIEKYGDLCKEDLIAAAEKQVTLKNGGQMVRKILLNSFYGALANVYFCLFDIRLAESVTKQGQLSIRWAGDWVNKELQKVFANKKDYIVYTDTDSIYVCLDDVVNRMGFAEKSTAETVEMLDNFCKSKMMPILNKGYDELQRHCNSRDQKMIMAREVISDNSVFCSKKHYALSVWNSEGVAFSEPYIKNIGLHVVKSSTPQIVRSAMNKTISLILNSTESDVQKYIKEFKKVFIKNKVEDISFPRGVNGMEDKYCDALGDFLSGVTVPINSRAAITYNKALKAKGLDNYQEIVAGDKIKYVYIELPNQINTNVMGFIDMLPPEFNLHDSIDWDLMYLKVYLAPMREIINLIGWSVEPIASLESFFD